MKKLYSRRDMIREAAGGYGAVALSWMLQQQGAFAASTEPAKPKLYTLLPKQPHFPAKAKRVIFIYISGGPSTIDMFDPKPGLAKYDGKSAPFEIKGRALNGSQQIMASPWAFQKYGQSGRAVSELLPNFARGRRRCVFRPVDDNGPNRSLHRAVHVCNRSRHYRIPEPRVMDRVRLGDREPESAGVCCPRNRSRHHPNPCVLVGVAAADLLRHSHGCERGSADVRHQPSEGHVGGSSSRQLLEIISGLNRTQKKAYPLDQDLESRIANYELAARMQLEATRVADLSKESEATKALYGIDDKISGPFSRNCLLARRLVESGVRFVTVISGTGGGAGWDCHNNIQGSLPGLCQSIDRGMYGLLTDLKSRGMLDDTLVVWSGEFGRLPTIEAKNVRPGRDHNPYGFSMWMAGGGVKPGVDYGDTDELGYAALTEYRLGHSDVHATIQHLFGLDFKKNTFSYEGRDETLVGVNEARVVNEILT